MTAGGSLVQAYSILDAAKKIPPSTVPRHLYDEKLNRIRNLEDKLKKDKVPAPGNDGDSGLQLEVDELRKAVQTNQDTIFRLEEAEEAQDEEVERLKALLADEKAEADRFYQKWTDEQAISAAERQQVAIEKKKGDEYFVARANRDRDYESLEKERDEVQYSSDRLQREYDVVLNKLLAHEPNYRPFTILRRDQSKPNDPRRRDTPAEDDGRPTRSVSILENRARQSATERTRDTVERLRREATQRPRRDATGRTQREDNGGRRDDNNEGRRDNTDQRAATDRLRRDKQQSSPFNAPERQRRPTPSIHDRAMSAVGGTSGGVTVRLPDISVFKGEDDSEDYKK